MRLLALLLMCARLSVASSAEQAPSPVQQRVEAALAAEVRARLGGSASVSVTNLEVAMRQDTRESIAVVPWPQARLGGPVEFVVIGAGASGRPVQVGRGRADVGVTVAHAQAARTLARGTVISDGDLVAVTSAPGRVPLRRLPTARELVGATTRRDLAAGEVFTRDAAALPLAVRAGDAVQAIASVGAVQITAELTAVDNGAEGSIVRVVNRQTRRELRAKVLRVGVVEVIHE
jgi:flagella basal body P-ring formation protein FlgA